MEILTELRREKHLALEELAEQVGISKSSLSTWERGERSPQMSKIKVLAKFFGVPVEQLIASAEADGNKVVDKPSEVRTTKNLAPKPRVTAPPAEPPEPTITRPEFIRASKLAMERLSEIIGDSKSSMLAVWAFRADLERRLF